MHREKMTPRLWLHLLKDTILRGWFPHVSATFMLASFVALRSFSQAAAGKTGVWDAFFPAFCLLMMIMGFAARQYVSYPLLAVLPMTRAARGRWVWFQHVVPMLVLYWTVVFLVKSAAQACGRLGLLAGMLTPLQISAVLVVLASPALMLLLSNRPALRSPWPSQLAYYAPFGLFAWWVYLAQGTYTDLFYAGVYAAGAASAVLLAASYLRAPRLLIAPRGGQVARKKTWGRTFSSPVRSEYAGPPKFGPAKVGPLWQLVLLEPLRAAPAVIGLLIALRLLGNGRVTIPIACGIFSMVAFMRSGRVAAIQARLMRTLPAKPARLALAVMGKGAAGAAYLAIAGCLLAVEPATVLVAVLTGACLGAFAPVVLVRHSRDAEFWLRAYSMPVGFIIMFAMILHWFQKAVPFLPVLGVAALLIVAASTFLLREVLLYETAYQYQKPQGAEAQW